MITLGIVIVLFIVTMGLLKIGDWHGQEGQFWSSVHLHSLLNPESTLKTYTPILNWCNNNRPSIWARLKPYRSPEERMKNFNRCKHDRVEPHSYQRSLGDVYLMTACLDCGTSIKFDLGFVAWDDDARERASLAIMEGRGYELQDKKGGANIFVKVKND